MKAGLPFRLSLWLLLMTSLGTLLIAEFLYDARSAVLAVALGAFLLVSASVNLILSLPSPPRFLAWFLNGAIWIAGLALVWFVALDQHLGHMDRAFALGRVVVLMMGLQLFIVRENRQMMRLVLMSLLPVTVAAITGGSIFLAPFFVAYMALAVCFLMIYQFQLQIEAVAGSRHIGYDPSEQQRGTLVKEVGSFWRQLRPLRFGVTFGSIVALSSAFSLLVFFAFPRLESGNLLGSSFNSRQVTGFTEEITIGGLENSEANKQVVARVQVQRNGQYIGSAKEPYYLRFAALEIYRESPGQEAGYSWARSFLNQIYGSEVPRGAIDLDSGLIIQEIMLNSNSGPFLPGAYPVVQVEGLEDEKLLQGHLDKVIDRFQKHPRQSVRYRVASEEHLADDEIFENFVQRLKVMGGIWGQTLPAIQKDDVYSRIVRSLAEELVERRLEISLDYHDALQDWLDFFQYQIVRERNQIGESPPPADLDLLGEAANADLEMELGRRVYSVALELAELDRDIAAQIENYLRTEFTYSLSVPKGPYEPIWEKDEDGEDVPVYPDPIEVFLSDKGHVGNCEYFASAMVKLCRSVGISARIAAGYLTQEYLPEFNYYLVRQRNAHAWVEVYTADQDWIRFDPTPAADVDLASKHWFSGLMNGINNFFERWQFRWLGYVTERQERQTQAALAISEHVGDWLEQLESPLGEGLASRKRNLFQDWFKHSYDEPYAYLFLRWIIFFLFLMNVGVGMKELYHWLIPWYLRRRSRRRLLASYTESSVDFYRHMLKMLQEINLYKPPHITPREFALQAQSYGEDFRPVGQISEAYYRVCYGENPPDPAEWQSVQEAIRHLEVVIRSLKKTAPRPYLWETKV